MNNSLNKYVVPFPRTRNCFIMVILQFLFLAFLVTSFTTIVIVGNIETKFGQILIKSVNKYDSKYAIFCCYTYCSKCLKCDKLTKDIIKDLPVTKYIVTEVDENIPYLENVAIMVFIPNLKLTLKEFQSVRKSKFYHKRAKFYFIFCDHIDVGLLTGNLESIWYLQIFDFVFAFKNQEDKFEFITYNDFIKDKKTIELSYPYEDMFPNKLLNMNGHELNVGINDDFPRLIMKNKKWKGRDVFFMDIVARKLNATLKYHVTETVNQNIDIIKEGKCEFSIIQKFIDVERDGIEFSYPCRMDSVVALIPTTKQITAHRLILSFLNVESLISFFILPLIMAYIHSKLSQGRHKISDLVFDYFGNIFGIAMTRLEKKRSFLLLFWFTYVVIVNVYVCISLLANILNVDYEDPIRTVEDLKKTDKTLITGPILTNITQNLISKNVVIMQRDQMKQLIFVQDNVSRIVIAPRSYFQSFFDFLEKEKMEVKVKILEDPLALGVNAYLVKKGSPYVKTINKMILMNSNFRYIKSAFSEKIKKQDARKILNFDHFWGSFLVIGIGYTLSFIVFLMEFFMPNIKRFFNHIRLGIKRKSISSNFMSNLEHGVEE